MRSSTTFGRIILLAALIWMSCPGMVPGTVAQEISKPDMSSGSIQEGLPAQRVSPTPGKPVVVLAGLHIHEITAIHLRDQTFTALFTLTLQWNDRRLAYDPKETGGQRRVFEGDKAKRVLDSIWSPSVIFFNALEKGTPTSHLTIYPTGFVNLRILRTVSSMYDARLRAFPFDVQSLRFVLTAFDTSDDSFRLAPLAFSLSTSDQSVVPSAYAVDGSATRFASVQTSAEGFQRVLVFSLDVSRQSRYYITRYMIPLVGLLFLSWTTFLMLDTKLHDRLKVIAITILSFITFMLFLNRDLPRIPYMTALGLYFALCGLLPILAAAQSIFVDRLIKRQETNRAIRLEATSRWAFPLLYVAIVIGIVLYVQAFR